MNNLGPTGLRPDGPRQQDRRYASVANKNPAQKFVPNPGATLNKGSQGKAVPAHEDRQTDPVPLPIADEDR